MSPQDNPRQLPTTALAGAPGAPGRGIGHGCVDLAPLEANRAALRRMVDEGRLAGGYALMVAHRGEVVHEDAYGFGNPEGRSMPVSVDTIMRLFSLSKSFTALAVLACHEDGLLHLDDLVEKHIPAWQGVRVVRHPCALRGSPEDLEVRRRPTVRHLITHTSGLGYRSNQGEAPSGAVQRSYSCLLQSVDSGECNSVQAFAEAIARLPLRFQPGTRWEYSFGFDVAARVVEVVSGQPFAEYLSHRILRPLCMRDTGFSVPPAHQRRLAGLFRRVPPASPDHGGPSSGSGAPVQLRCIDPPAGESAWSGRKLPALCSAGGIIGDDMARSRGLVSTARDALRLALLLRNGGVCAETGHRVLKECTVRLLLRNWLPMPSVIGKSHLEDRFTWERGVGFSPLGQIRVYHPRPKDQESSAGEVSHGGWAGTFWTFDPKLDLCFAWFAQDPDLPDFTELENIWMMARRAVGAVAWKPADLPLLGARRTRRPAEQGEGEAEKLEEERGESPSAEQERSGKRRRPRSPKERAVHRKTNGAQSGGQKQERSEESHSPEHKAVGARRRLGGTAAGGA